MPIRTYAITLASMKRDFTLFLFVFRTIVTWLKRPAIFLFLVLINLSIFGQEGIPEFKAKEINISNADLKNKFHRFTTIQLETAELSRHIHRKSNTSFHLGLGLDKAWDIDLQPSDIVTPNYILKIQTAQGLQTIASHPDFLFKGKVKGSSKDEQVRLTIKEGLIYGSIQANGKEYFIESLNRFTDIKKKDAYVVYEAKDVISSEPFSCGFQDKKSSLRETEQQKGLKEQSPQNTICKKIKFISVADY